MFTQEDTYLTKTLQRYGLSEQETLIYLTCLEQGEIGIVGLSKRTQINRTTIYRTADPMVGKGMLRFIQKGAHRFYSAEDPRRLEGILRQESDLLDVRKTFLNSVLPTLSMKFSSAPSKPILSFYQGQEEVQQIFENIILAKPEEVYFIGEVATLEKAVGERYLKNWVKRRIEAGIKTKAIRTRKTEKSDPLYKPSFKLKRDVRFVPGKLEFPTFIGIYGHKVAFISSVIESYGVLQESKDLSTSMRSLFNSLWKNSS